MFQRRDFGHVVCVNIAGASEYCECVVSVRDEVLTGNQDKNEQWKKSLHDGLWDIRELPGNITMVVPTGQR